jgi:hypothetical protein
MFRIAPSQAEELNACGVKIDFGADESMRPRAVHADAVAEYGRLSSAVGASQEEDTAAERPCEVGLPTRGKRRAHGQIGASVGIAVGEDVRVRLACERLDGRVLETLPDFPLPEAVVRLDAALKSLLVGRGEDGHDAELLADAGDPAEGVGDVMGTLEDGVVVELGVGRQADLSPSGKHALGGKSCRDEVCDGPGVGGFSVEGDCVEDLNVASSADDESFDDVEAVEFDVSASEVGEVPASGGRRSSHASSSIEEAVSGEDATDGASAGKRLNLES